MIQQHRCRTGNPSIHHNHIDAELLSQVYMTTTQTSNQYSQYVLQNNYANIELASLVAYITTT